MKRILQKFFYIKTYREALDCAAISFINHDTECCKTRAYVSQNGVNNMVSKCKYQHITHRKFADSSTVLTKKITCKSNQTNGSMNCQQFTSFIFRNLFNILNVEKGLSSRSHQIMVLSQFPFSCHMGKHGSKKCIEDLIQSTRTHYSFWEEYDHRPSPDSSHRRTDS